MSPQVVKSRHVPMRTCIGCGQKQEKKALLRFVLDPEESLELDLSQKKSGRGAYLCKQLSCANQAVRGKKLHRAFRKNLNLAVYEQLLGYFKSDE
ncbi:MAG: YlxR family protein [Calditrichaeota bacterium]|nr:MAG: YlxR family protein [Calditrichota bacterium]